MYLANYYFYNFKPSPSILRKHRVLQNLRKNKDIVITKPDKGNGFVNLDQKLYDNAIQEIISDTSKFEKLNEDPTLMKTYPSGSAPAHTYGTPKMHKFSSSDTFPKLHPIVSSIGTLN